MAGLVPAIHVFDHETKEDVDARDKPGHDDLDDTYLPAPHRRHHHFVAAAGAAVDFLAGAELQVLAHADPDFAKAPAGADHRNRRTAEARIDLDKGGLERLGGYRFRLRQLQEFVRDLHRRAGFSDVLEIGP